MIHGCSGKMGTEVRRLIESEDAVVTVIGVDPFLTEESFPMVEKVSEFQEDVDVIIDFSNPILIDGLLDYVEERKIPLVLCTTGLSEEQLKRVDKVSEKVAVLKSANMSLGVNVLMKLLQEATRVLNPAGYDIEMIEKHHNLKVDAPSGTALALADAMNEVLHNQYTYSYDRSNVREKRNKKEIGISAVRGGTIVGEHEVIFAGVDEVIEIKHTAYSKGVFAKGAIEAAKFLTDKPAGMYDMSHLIEE